VDLQDLENVMGGTGFSIEKQQYLAQLLEEFERRKTYGGLRNIFVPGTPYGIDKCPKHAEFFRLGATYRERLFQAGNRCGKTRAGAVEMAAHLTGLYPEWWMGKRFSTGVNAWACAMSSQKCRETVQTELFGEPGKEGTGLIPADMIVRCWAKQGVPNAIDMAEIRHISGKNSIIGFKGYEQKLSSFVGTKMNVIWMDEEPPNKLYNECLVRTMMPKGEEPGIMYVTLTPITGLTPFLVDFDRNADHFGGAQPILPPSNDAESDEEAKRNRSWRNAVISAGWDDAPWVDDDEKARIFAKTPDYLRESRRSGAISMGEGNVFRYPIENLLVTPFEIPPSWRRVYGMDVGYKVTCVVLAAIDPNTDTIYLYDDYYGERQEPSVHAMRIKEKTKGWIPGLIDPAARGRSQIDGRQLYFIYRDLGLNIAIAQNTVTSALTLMEERMGSGKLKVFRNMHKWREEYVKYRRDERGEIIKEFDHEMDCTRYLVSGLQLARPFFEDKDVINPFNGGDSGSGRKYF
jgi:phage terminase large subunit-like protein